MGFLGGFGICIVKLSEIMSIKRSGAIRGLKPRAIAPLAFVGFMLWVQHTTTGNFEMTEMRVTVCLCVLREQS